MTEQDNIDAATTEATEITAATTEAAEAAPAETDDATATQVAETTAPDAAVEADADADPDAEEKVFDPAVDLPMYREGMNWFVLRVASNKENSVRDTLERKVQIEGLKQSVGRIMMPTEKTRTLKGGKQRITETKLYPGYIFVEMRLENDGRIPQDVFFLIK